MNNLNWLLRAVQWVRNPPSEKRVILVFAVIALVLAIAAIQHFGLWPKWATMEHGRGMRLPR